MENRTIAVAGERLQQTLAVLAAIAAVVVIFVPDLQVWMQDHGLIGWGLAALVVMVSPVLAHATVRSELARQSARKDYDLVVERLGDWTLDSDFYRYICEDAIPTMYRSRTADDIREKLDRWRRDTRTVKNKKLREQFENVVAAADKFDEMTFQYLWTDDRRSAARDREHEYLAVPREWSGPEKKEAYDAFGDARRGLVTALQQIFATLHERRSTDDLGTVEKA